MKSASELRDEFDRSFALRREQDDVVVAELIGIELSGNRHALRLAELASVIADRKTVPMPGSAAELAGIVGVRGVIVPVFDLAALLGYPRGTAFRWLAVAAQAPVAFAFERFSGHFRVARGSIAAAESRGHVREVAMIEARAWPIVSVASLVDALAQHVKETQR